MNAPSALPRVAVIVPTWRRADSLVRCLRALAAQSHPPHAVVVVAREGDAASVDAARSVPLAAPGSLHVVVIPIGGVVEAMSAGLARAEGEFIALTDDDAEPAPDWIARLAATFAQDERIGAVGGRDQQPHERGFARTVGIVQWFGRVIGRHHLGAGPARDVDVLKGVNCAFRAPLLRAVGFDPRLRGGGAQLHWELGTCLPIRRAGWRVVYDPAISVTHHVEPRASADELHRGRFSGAALVDATHNEALALLEHLDAAPTLTRTVRILAWRLWATLIGTVASPGVLNAFRLRLQRKPWALEAFLSTRRGRALAFATSRSQPRSLRVTAPTAGTP